MSTDFVNKSRSIFVDYSWHKSQKWLGINT